MPDNTLINGFFDSNVWLYAFITGDDATKTATATSLISQSQPVVSTQVINEVCVNLIRKAKFTEGQIEQLVRGFYSKYRVVELREETLITASHLRRRYSLSFWDGLIVASALEANVPVLYSEDMQDGLNVAGRLRIENPFV